MVRRSGHHDPDTVLPAIWVMDLLRETPCVRFTGADAAEPKCSRIG